MYHQPHTKSLFIFLLKVQPPQEKICEIQPQLLDRYRND